MFIDGLIGKTQRMGVFRRCCHHGPHRGILLVLVLVLVLVLLLPSMNAGWVLAIITIVVASSLTSCSRCPDSGACLDRRRSSSGYWIREHILDPGAPPQREGSLHPWVLA
jgi:hypothetical protein